MTNTITMTIKDRIMLTLENIEYQNGIAYFDDLIQLENVLELLKQGKSIDERF